MRLSIDSELGGYIVPGPFLQASVMLNGKPVSYCVCADEERGEAYFPSFDHFGNPLIREGHLVYHRLTGDVKISGVTIEAQ